MQTTRERGRIGRTFYKTYCDCLYIDSNNEPKPLEYVLDGYYNDCIRAQSEVAKSLGQTTVMVRSITHTAYYASMSLEKFLSNVDFIGEEEEVK